MYLLSTSLNCGFTLHFVDPRKRAHSSPLFTGHLIKVYLPLQLDDAELTGCLVIAINLDGHFNGTRLKERMRDVLRLSCTGFAPTARALAVSKEVGVYLNSTYLSLYGLDYATPQLQAVRRCHVDPTLRGPRI
jgi:hypothetical protein